MKKFLYARIYYSSVTQETLKSRNKKQAINKFKKRCDNIITKVKDYPYLIIEYDDYTYEEIMKD